MQAVKIAMELKKKLVDDQLLNVDQVTALSTFLSHSPWCFWTGEVAMNTI